MELQEVITKEIEQMNEAYHLNDEQSFQVIKNAIHYYGAVQRIENLMRNAKKGQIFDVWANVNIWEEVQNYLDDKGIEYHIHENYIGDRIFHITKKGI